MASDQDSAPSTALNMASKREVSALTPLNELRNAGQRNIMELVNKLRRAGLNNVLQLPQLVVCGDQSSGKSSVLEAISEIPFPRKESLCTRFATEIVMRDHATNSISTKIIPDKLRPESEKDSLRTFSESFQNFDKLPELYERATRAMGLDNQVSGITRAFAADVLTIEISGSGLPELTLVDLPGLIHAESKYQSQTDVEFIRNLVETYISNKRTIILVVISAKNDYANQIVLKLCRRFDPNGSRTLGIITKSDTLLQGGESERNFIDLALNRDIKFERGWHLLKNRTDEQQNTTFRERNLSEHTFFSQGNYRDLPADMKGIGTLKDRLSILLESHLKQELPNLIKELNEELAATNKSLGALGKAISTLPEQRECLMKIGMESHEILKSAVDGRYDLDFFAFVAWDEPVNASSNIRRLRAVIQDRNIDFAKRIKSRGHKYHIAPYTGPTPAPPESEEVVVAELDGESSEVPEDSSPVQKLSRSKAVKWVLAVLQRSRGQELPGTFNPLIISQLFWQQSEPWDGLARTHLDTIAGKCQDFFKVMMNIIAPPEVAARLYRFKVNEALNMVLDGARKELGLILADKKRHPMTYNHYSTDTKQKLQQRRYDQNIKDLADKAKVSVQVKNFQAGAGYYTEEYIDPEKLESNLKSHLEQDMDKVPAEDILDLLVAYYKDERKYFVGAVTKQVIERHLAVPLPSLLSPLVITNLSDDEVKNIMKEPSAITRERKALEERKRMLEEGKRVFEEALLDEE